MLSVGVVTYGIFKIQSNSRDAAKNFEASVGESNPTSRLIGTTDQSLTPNEQDSALGVPSAKDKSPINKEIQANLDLAKKYYESNQLNKALEYAKLAANAGNALGMYRVAFILVAQNKLQEAIVWYEKAANLGYGDAFWNLGALFERLKKTELALSWYEKGAKINSVGSLNALGFFYADKKKDALKAIPYYKKSAELGSIMGMANLGLVYEEIGDKDSAKKWYSKASDLGDIDASFNLGILYEDTADWTNARKYYKRAADKKDPAGMYNLALVLGNHFGQRDEGCVLFKEALTIETIDSKVKNLVEASIRKSCMPTASASPGSASKPIASSDKFSISAPLAEDVIVDTIDGRVFKDGLNFWRISLTNSQAEKVPLITGIQFRLIGFKNAEWLGVPYKLKKDSKDGVVNLWDGVYAEVDDLLFAFQFKNMSYCPEFRVIREERNKIIHIWNKGQPECATDYNP